jgi:FMN phosphatase YigB (HAD superfamily)
MNKVKTIALDVDGVLLDFTRACDEYVKKNLGIEPIKKLDGFNLNFISMKTRYGLGSDEDVLILLDKMVADGFYKNIPALDGVKEAVDKIKSLDYKIIVITAIHDGAKNDRLENLKNILNLVPDEIYCVGMGKSKSQIIKEVHPDIFVDDRMKYLKGGDKVFHSVWVDQEESQEGDETLVNVHVKSLKEWTDRYLELVTENLNEYYEGAHTQIPLKLESVDRKYKESKDKPLPEEEYQELLKVATPRIR